jgi:hypothetical protein
MTSELSRRILSRSLVAVGTIALVGIGGTSPAFASGSVADNHPTGLMSPGTAVLIFAGIPLLVAAVIWLLVSAPSWTRKARTSDSDAFTGDALVVSSDTEAEMTIGGGDFGSTKTPMDIAAGIDVPPGGTSARW